MSQLPARAALAISLCLCAATAPAREVMLMNRISPSSMTLYVANADGSGERRLLPDSAGMDYDPSFSPDGWQMDRVHLRTRQ
jgi:hypothetical protein